MLLMYVLVQRVLSKRRRGTSHASSSRCKRNRFASGLVGDAEKMRFQHDKLARVAEAAHRLWF